MTKHLESNTFQVEVTVRAWKVVDLVNEKILLVVVDTYLKKKWPLTKSIIRWHNPANLHKTIKVGS
jgi:hypothetical protein